MSKEEVVLLDFWISAFCIRAKIALAEKGVAFEVIQEDLFGGKSELLLKLNPIYQEVPVLLHNGKPVCESTNIVSYIGETWPSPPLLPPCPYGRASARFWADFIDKKRPCDEQRRGTRGGKKELLEILMQLEEVLGEKDYFGGDSFGFLDITALPFPWLYSYEEFGGLKLDYHCPKFYAWIKRCMERESVAKHLPDTEKVYDFVVNRKNN
ncbi:hypothetical protein F0562_005352 [Nyssa sinensis]|uniref:glutathione transferase n=1 Tax=Nyssa sinensis TaxID=561372 RepID=A0A5J5AK84_9ASTE|nr:hypothetical protein F0562_005352 [Nyssa sinensis]